MFSGRPGAAHGPGRSDSLVHLLSRLRYSLIMARGTELMQPASARPTKSRRALLALLVGTAQLGCASAAAPTATVPRGVATVELPLVPEPRPGDQPLARAAPLLARDRGASNSPDPTGDQPAEPASGVASSGAIPPNAPGEPSAAERYRRRIAVWASGGFRVTGTGLAPDLLSQPVRAVLHILPDGVAGDFTIKPGGAPAVVAGVRRNLESLRGRRIPPKPQDYTGDPPSELQLVFVCNHLCD